MMISENMKVWYILCHRIYKSGFNIRLGKANIALFDYILPHVFEEVTPVQHLSEANEDMGNFDIILEPSITSYSCNFVKDFITGWPSQMSS